ncbi:hypothetical protein M8J77_012798 [Diaphorina citri]|nr:hypothetical protein M8J77_012798 [Diaphorina citri]
MIDEVYKTIKELKKEKAPGHDGITNDLLIHGIEPLCLKLQEIFNRIMYESKIPEQWTISKIILLYKKGPREDISAYEITAVYKFNTFIADGESVKYLNTCTVASLQENDRGLPLFNITADTPLPESTTIPRLYDGQNSTRWQWISSDGNTAPLDVPTYADNTAEYSALLFQSDFSLDPDESMFSYTVNNSKIRKEKTVSAYYVYRDNPYTVFETTDIGENSILRVNFRRLQDLKIKLYYGSDNSYILITVENSHISVCQYSNYVIVNSCYGGNFSTDRDVKLYMTLKSQLFIYDQMASKIHNTNIVPTSKLTRIAQTEPRDYDYIGRYTYYALLESYPSTIISPWLDLDNNTSVIIFYDRQPGSKVNVYVEEQNTDHIIHLVPQESVVTKRSNSSENVLAKVNIIFPKGWTKQKRIKVEADNFVIRIGNIWEERYVDMSKINMAKVCVRSYLDEIYNTLEDSTVTDNVITCFNGGSPMDNSLCSCPPGFTGNECEIPCDRNRFGPKCSKMCSTSSNECKGMVLCTSYYGCSCATGYQGEQCLEHCPKGYYGADCKETCGQCVDGCDQYTGACRGGCTTPYLIGPHCKHAHSYLKNPPKVLHSSFNTVNLQIDLTASNIEKSYDHTMFYMVQYRQDMSSTWNDGSYEIFKMATSNISVEGLKPGSVYYLRVILVDETLETHDPDLTKSVKTQTECTVMEREKNLNVTSLTNTSIALTWNGDTDLGPEECPFTSYILEIEEMQNNYVESQKIVDIRTNSYKIENLSPGQTYHIKLKKNTIYGESIPIPNINVTTDDTIDFSIEVAGVTVKQTESQVNIEWFQSPVYKTYYIKYKLIRRLSCIKDRIESPIQVVITTNTKYTLLYLEPNAQYQLFVTADKNQNMKAHNFTFITSSKVPTIAPSLLTHKSKVTNESAQIYWTDFSLSCQNMNGIFKKYIIELYDTQNNSLRMYETKDNHLEMTGLRSQTQYTVKVRYVNHVGFDRSTYMEHNFIAKATPVLKVQELTAYMTSSDAIGLRWKISETNMTNIKIRIQLYSNIWNKTIDVNMTTLSSKPSSFRCKPWPSYVCFDVTELKQNTKYRITVNVFSEELPEGNPSEAIHAITRETMPSAVSDIQMNTANTNMTISWRIPDLLNGILRKFVIEVEHLSSFDESQCCQSTVEISYIVREEQEIYSHVIHDIQNASSYQITIRPFTKRVGPEASQIVITPPPNIPINKMPQVQVDGEDIMWSKTNNIEESSTMYSELASDILVIVHDLNGEATVTPELLGFRRGRP